MTFKSEKALEQRLKRPSSILSCHFCGNQWDCHNRCFVCPRCHTVYNPKATHLNASPLPGFGGELRQARLRENLSQAALGRKLEISKQYINDFEHGKPQMIQTGAKVLHEKLRIWIESTKPPLDRHREIDQMFKTRKRRKKVKENG